MSGNVFEEKDLGVTMSNDLKWEKQCSEIVKKANKILGMIKRNFVDRSKDIILPLFKSLVRPHLEYSCQVWCPHYKKDIKLIEGVQRRATKLVHGLENLTYDDRQTIRKVMQPTLANILGWKLLVSGTTSGTFLDSQLKKFSRMHSEIVLPGGLA